MDEASIIHWFAGHPFWRNEVTLVLGAWGSLAIRDWTRFQNYKATVDNTATWSLRVAAWEYAHALIVAVGPPLVAEIWHILGAAGEVVALLASFFFGG